MVNSTFASARTGFEISLGLTGALTLWMGLMKVGEKGGVVNILGRLFGPFFRKLFPELPVGHPAFGSMILNFSANMLGLDNAATPMGLKAMKEMQDVNPRKDTASNAQIMFLVLNASGLTIIPVSIMVYRTQLGAANPADIFIPILISTYVATLVAMISVAIVQRINLFDRVIFAYAGGLTAIIAGIILYFTSLPKEQIANASTFAANFILFTIIIVFIVLALVKKVNVYDAFIEGAKEGFSTAIKIIPFLVAILVAIGIFRASGAMDIIVSGFDKLFGWFGLDTRFTEALPVALMKPLSGSGARGLMIDAMTIHGADSFISDLLELKIQDMLSAAVFWLILQALLRQYSWLICSSADIPGLKSVRMISLTDSQKIYKVQHINKILSELTNFQILIKYEKSFYNRTSFHDLRRLYPAVSGNQPCQ
jgi:spore maturation protein SpmA